MEIDLGKIIRRLDPDFLGPMSTEELLAFVRLFGELGSNIQALEKAKEIWIQKGGDVLEKA